MGVSDEELEAALAAARAAMARAYAPYSGFAVGAALLLRDGRVVTGANVENASYGLTLCAERVALARLLQEGYVPAEVRLVAVASDGPGPTMPCGACRQWLWELVPRAVVCGVGREGTEWRIVSVADLLPLAFGPASLRGAAVGDPKGT